MRALRLGELARAQIQVLKRGQRHGTGSFDHQLVLLQHEQDHLVDVALGDGDQIVEELVEQREGQVARTLHGNAFGGGTHLVGCDDATGGQRILPCRAAFRNGADHTHFRLECLDGERHAGAQTTTAERHDHVGDVRHIFENLKTDGALSAQHLVIVERRNIDHAFVVAQLLRVSGRFVEHLTTQHHVGAIGLGGIHLQRRSDLRHADGGLRATLTGRVCHALGMVACGSGDDAMRKLLVGQRCDLVIRATNLE